MNASESSNKPSSPEQPSADQRRFAPVSSTIELLTATSEKLYSKLTPRRVDQFLRDSSIVSYGLDTAAQGWNRVKPLVRFVDDCSDRVVGLGVYGYEHLVLESLQSIVGMLKQFYSCETNPFARVSLLFLTAILADPEMMNTISEEDFEQLFRRDPQFGQQHFQTIVKAFYQSVKSHWMGTKDSSHADLVRCLLYVTAATMEQLLIAKDDRVGFFAQKYKDYFFSEDAPKKPSFTRTSFREFTRSTLQLRELTPQLVQMADQYLQIALVLFKLSNLGSRGAVDWLVDSIRFGKRGVDGAFRACRGGFTTIVLKVQVFPQQALAFTCEKAGALATLSREAFVAVSVRASKLQALQYCFELAHKVDLLLRDQGDALLQILRKNRDILKAVVVTYRDELAKFLEGMPERCSQASQQAQQAVLQFLRENASVVLDLAKLSKETLEVLLETTTQFLLTNKQHLTDFCVRYGAVVLEQAKKGKHLAFSVLRVDEIASLVARTFKAAEEYFRIKDSLSKLDRQAEDSEEREPLAASEDN